MKQNKTDLQQIPGVGPNIAQDMNELGIFKAADLVGKDPEELYNRYCRLKNVKIDRCLLYCFRCAVYFTENIEYDPELLKWWNWKDRVYKNQRGKCDKRRD